MGVLALRILPPLGTPSPLEGATALTLAFALGVAMLTAGCRTDWASRGRPTTEDGRPTIISLADIPSDQLVTLADDRRVGVRIDAGRLDLVVMERDLFGNWTGHIITSTRATPGQDSLHLVSFGGQVDFTWNSFVYGTAEQGTTAVSVAGLEGAVGGRVMNGVWVIALRQKDLEPGNIQWTFHRADGTARTGVGIFGPVPS